MDYKKFETERLYINSTSEQDDTFIFKLLNTPKWIEFIGDRNIQNKEEARNYIREKMTPQLERLGYSNYTLVRKSDGEKIGTCGLYDRDGLDGIDIGFAFLPEYERKGYAFEAANRMKKAAFEEFGLDKINAITAKNNSSSQKLLEKLGLKLRGITQLPNSSEELLLYYLNKTDYKSDQ